MFFFETRCTQHALASVTLLLRVRSHLHNMH